jgi:DNA-binding GntR family transcriptional regulator
MTETAPPYGTGTRILRMPLRQEARKAVLEWILDGTLPPGSDVNEASLAASLGVSRTPLREALLALEQDGFLVSETGRGFRVVPLTERDVEEIYPMLWTLEGLAVRDGANLTAERKRRLTAINRELEAAASNPEAAMKLDREWHDTLLQGSENRRLRDVIAGLKDLARRYELAYMRHAGKVILSGRQHRGILVALDGGNIERALALLKENWRVSQTFLVPWIRSRQASDPTPPGGRGRRVRA